MIHRILLCLGLAAFGVFAGMPAVSDSAARLLQEASANQFRGGYSAEVTFIKESFLKGADSLHGTLAFNDSGGDRRLKLAGRDQAFEWWSRNFGQEQWWKDDKTDRTHRIPYRSLKKPAFTSLLTYEDLLKLPADYLLDFHSCQKLGETDSTYQLSLLLRPTPQSRYGYLDVTLSKNPLLLRRVVFFSIDGRKLKSLEVTEYRPESGKFLPLGLRVFDGDSLASLRLSLLNPKTLAPPAVSDKTAAPRASALPRLLAPANPPQLAPRDTSYREEMESEGDQSD